MLSSFRGALLVTCLFWSKGLLATYENAPSFFRENTDHRHYQRYQEACLQIKALYINPSKLLYDTQKGRFGFKLSRTRLDISPDITSHLLGYVSTVPSASNDQDEYYWFKNSRCYCTIL